MNSNIKELLEKSFEDTCESINNSNATPLLNGFGMFWIILQLVLIYPITKIWDVYSPDYGNGYFIFSMIFLLLPTVFFLMKVYSFINEKKMLITKKQGYNTYKNAIFKVLSRINDRDDFESVKEILKTHCDEKNKTAISQVMNLTIYHLKQRVNALDTSMRDVGCIKCYHLFQISPENVNDFKDTSYVLKKEISCPNCGVNSNRWNKPEEVERIKEELKQTAIKSHEPIKCPSCHSTQFYASDKGFSVGKAILGNLAFGSIGTVAGLAGGKKVYLTCLSCGHRWKAGN